MNFRLRVAKDTKEPETLDMIHMQVSKENIHPAQGARQRKAQAPDASSSVQNKHCAIIPSYFNTGGVSPITGSVKTRGGQRAARTPKCNLHTLTSHNMASAPKYRSDCPLIGKAVTSIKH